MSENREKLLTVRVRSTGHQRLELEAEREGVTLSALVRQVIEAALVRADRRGVTLLSVARELRSETADELRAKVRERFDE